LPDLKLRPIAQTAKWNAADYAANSVVQQTWARELIAKLNLRGDEHILDVGCGDGKVTAEIARTVPRGLVTGIDASPEMIAFCAQKTFPPKNFQSEISNLRRAENRRFRRCSVRHHFFQCRAALGG
jgi:trans-aconitate 2-methyltransferase